MATLSMPAEDRKKALDMYDQLRLTARARCATALLRSTFSSKIGDHQPIKVTELLKIIKDIISKSKLRDKHRDQIEEDARKVEAWLTSHPAVEDTATVSDLPSEEVGAVTVHILAACDTALMDFDDKLRSVEEDLKTFLSAHQISPEKLLMDELRALKNTTGRHTVALIGQPFLRVHRQMLCELLEWQTKITTLVLQECSIRDTDFLEILGAIKGLQHLRTLSLAANLLSVETVAVLKQALADPQNFPSLQLLDLHGNELPSSEASELQTLVAHRFEESRIRKVDPWVNSLGITPSRKLKVLCLDGGGIKGLVQVECLMRLERMTGKHPNDLFDLIIGTSTGGLLAAALRLSLPLSEIKEMYLTLGAQIFSKQAWTVLWLVESAYRGARSFFTGGDWYSSSILVSMIQEKLGTGSLKDIEKPLALVSVDIKRGVEHIFRTYETTVVYPEGSTRDVPLWQALRATSAAPTFFSPITIDGTSYVDGAVGFDNPSLLAYTEITHHVNPRDIVLVSLGTGFQGLAEQSQPYSLLAEQLARTAMHVLVSPEPVHQNMKAVGHASGMAYHRINPTACRPMMLDVGNLPMDECNELVLLAMCQAVSDWLGQNPGTMGRVASDLMEAQPNSTPPVDSEL